jgi:hypothetical protein
MHKITLRSKCDGILHNLLYYASHQNDITDMVDGALQEESITHKESEVPGVIQDIFRGNGLEQSSISVTGRAQEQNRRNREEPEKGDKFYCLNETHTESITFDTQMALTRLMLTVHKCHYPMCHYSNMFESQLEKHLLIHNKEKKKEYCIICMASVEDLKSHSEIHPACTSCQL